MAKSHILQNGFKKLQEIIKGLIINEDLSLAADRQEDIDRSEVALYGLKKGTTVQPQ